MDKKLDEALRQALAPCEEADFWLNQKILNRAAGLAENKEDIKEEKNKMGIRRKKRGLSAAAIAAAVLCTSSVTAYAAWKYLSSSDIAAHVQDRKLAESTHDVKVYMELAVGNRVTALYEGYEIEHSHRVSLERDSRWLAKQLEDIQVRLAVLEKKETA